MKLKTVVVDDEERARKLIVDYVKKSPGLELVAQFNNGIEALDYGNSHGIDLLLLDIQMPDITGLDLLRNLQSTPMVIFTTAYSDYAVEGFDLEAVDYLVKPIMFPRFLKAANKALNQAMLKASKNGLEKAELKDEGSSTSIEGADHLFIKVDNHWVRLGLSEIGYIEANGDYVAIHLMDNRKLLTLQTMSQMAERLSASNFVRIHRSFIVNLNRVDTIEKDHLLIEGKDLSIGKSYRASFFQLLSAR